MRPTDAHNQSIEPEERMFHVEVYYKRLRYAYMHLLEVWLRMRIAIKLFIT